MIEVDMAIEGVLYDRMSDMCSCANTPRPDEIVCVQKAKVDDDTYIELTAYSNWFDGCPILFYEEFAKNPGTGVYELVRVKQSRSMRPVTLGDEQNGVTVYLRRIESVSESEDEEEQ